jgi:hypothetical protein
MKCEYSDGMKVDYSGSLRIRKGEEVNVYITEDFIPANVKGYLSKAESEQSCEELRKIAKVVTATVGSRVCIHE